MSAKRSRAIRAGVEGLERRETPGGAHALAAAAAASSVTIGGGGLAAITESAPAVNGQLATTVLVGTNRTLGSYSAQLAISYGNGLSRGLGSGVFTASDGDTIDVRLKATAPPPVFPHATAQQRDGSDFYIGIPSGQIVDSAPGSIRFTITGGTGAFANATGTFRLTGNVNALTPFHYSLSGKFRK